MGRIGRFVMLAVATGLTVPAAAQFSDSFSFLQAVKDRDGDKVMPLVNKPGAPVINTRDSNTGETALHIVTKAHDMTWLGFLLQKGAQPNMKDRQGNTPLMVAAQTGDADAARLLIDVGATVDAINNSGETPLIRATLNRDINMVRLLTLAGADPKIRDTIQGKSAQDYAREDRRSTAIAKTLDEIKPRGPSATVAGPARPH
ncbi:ankyrin repeat domain-containing protein [Sphingomonas bacterium]|uniref:ankyrin repeat domain-containing protein n=1 Tax=Sphingomonas bacterium TaxID=1895847 RepID=UPI001575CD35|nr:ankyrin repeat domain-containing protein [Sphingomonas bacterium]